MDFSFNSRVRLFGLAVFAYGFVALVTSGLDYFGNGQGTKDLCLMVGGAIMTAGGIYVILRQDQDKMDAIGVYAITFGIFKMFRAYGEGGTFWIIPFLVAIPFVIMGIRYVLGTSVSVISNILCSLLYIVIDLFRLNLVNLLDIFILVFFISILVSRDVLINTTIAKRFIGKKVEYEDRAKADIDYAKSYVDAFKDGMENGVDAAVDDIYQSTEERSARVAESKVKGETASGKEYILNRETNTFEEKK